MDSVQEWCSYRDVTHRFVSWYETFKSELVFVGFYKPLWWARGGGVWLQRAIHEPV